MQMNGGARANGVHKQRRGGRRGPLKLQEPVLPTMVDAMVASPAQQPSVEGASAGPHCSHDIPRTAARRSARRSSATLPISRTTSPRARTNSCSRHMYWNTREIRSAPY